MSGFKAGTRMAEEQVEMEERYARNMAQTIGRHKAVKPKERAMEKSDLAWEIVKLSAGSTNYDPAAILEWYQTVLSKLEKDSELEFKGLSGMSDTTVACEHARQEGLPCAHYGCASGTKSYDIVLRRINDGDDHEGDVWWKYSGETG